MAVSSVGEREPRARRGHAAVVAGNNMLVWGGSRVDKTSEVEIFDPVIGTWLHPRQLHGDSLPRGLNNMAVASDGKKTYVFGGLSSFTGRRYNTLFAIDQTSLECTELVPSAGSASPPSARSGSRIVCNDRRLVMYGGLTDTSVSDELYVFDLDKGNEEMLICVYHSIHE